jgi:hypothetical protein
VVGVWVWAEVEVEATRRDDRQTEEVGEWEARLFFAAAIREGRTNTPLLGSLWWWAMRSVGPTDGREWWWDRKEKKKGRRAELNTGSASALVASCLSARPAAAALLPGSHRRRLLPPRRHVPSARLGARDASR